MDQQDTQTADGQKTTVAPQGSSQNRSRAFNSDRLGQFGNKKPGSRDRHTRDPTA